MARGDCWKAYHSPWARWVSRAWDRINSTLLGLSTTSTRWLVQRHCPRPTSPFPTASPLPCCSRDILGLLWHSHLHHAQGLRKVPLVGNSFREIIFLCAWHHIRFNRTQRRTGPDSSRALKKGFRTCTASVAWTITALLHKLPNGCMEIENHTYKWSSSGSTNQFACKIVISTLRFIFCSFSKRLNMGGEAFMMPWEADFESHFGSHCKKKGHS